MIRELRDDDIPGLVRLLQDDDPDFCFTEPGFRHRWGTEPPRARRRAWCVGEDGEIVAWGRSGLVVDSARDDVAWIGVTVRPECRGRGIGAALYELAEGHVRSLGAARFLASTRDEPAGRRFAETRGFTHTRTERLSRLDPREVDRSGFEALMRAKADAGFGLVSMAEVRDRPELVFELDVAASRDVPTDEPFEDIRFEEWLDDYWRHPNTSFEGSFVLLHDDRAVSFAMLRADPVRARALNNMTGTLQEVRGRGLARLVKLASISWAAANGITSIATANDETNRAMIALNESLGYRPYAAELAYVREL